jgi:hypothetical protein
MELVQYNNRRHKSIGSEESITKASLIRIA